MNAPPLSIRPDHPAHRVGPEPADDPPARHDKMGQGSVALGLRAPPMGMGPGGQRADRAVLSTEHPQRTAADWCSAASRGATSLLCIAKRGLPGTICSRFRRIGRSCEAAVNLDFTKCSTRIIPVSDGRIRMRRVGGDVGLPGQPATALGPKHQAERALQTVSFPQRQAASRQEDGPDWRPQEPSSRLSTTRKRVGRPIITDAAQADNAFGGGRPAVFGSFTQRTSR